MWNRFNILYILHILFIFPPLIYVHYIHLTMENRSIYMDFCSYTVLASSHNVS